LPSAFTEVVRRTIGGVTIEIRTNVTGLAAAFAHRYSDHPPVRRPDFTFTVAEESNGYVLWSRHDGVWRWLDGRLSLDAVLFLTDATAMSAVIHYDERLATMHAAGVQYRGVTAAIAADSEGGKTTTALACARAGFRVYSDERVMLRDGVVVPFLRRCRVRDESAGLLCDDSADSLTMQLQQNRAISWTETFGADCVAGPASLHALFVIAGKAGPRIEPIEWSNALPAITRWFDCKGGALQRMARAVSTLQNVRCYRLFLGTPGETATALAQVLEAGIESEDSTALASRA
jgi:hypothetical protein